MTQNKKLLMSLICGVFGMFMLSFAAFPLYNLFCKITGYGGTPKINSQASNAIGKKEFTVRFNADVEPGFDWEFKPSSKPAEVITGENKLIFYEAKNSSSESLTGVATYNIVPQEAAVYFNKIECFCFQKQTLKPGEKIIMPVSFFIDPDIENDINLKNVKTVTLSYTFFQDKKNGSEGLKPQNIKY